MLNEEELHEETKELGGGTGRRKRLNVETQKALKESLFFKQPVKLMKDTERALKEDYVHKDKLQRPLRISLKNCSDSRRYGNKA